MGFDLPVYAPPVLKFGGYERYTEMVDVQRLLAYRKYARTSIANGLLPGGWEQLKQDIAANGIHSPLIFQYNPANGLGFVGEGNHRLSIAWELGMTHVPLRIERNNTIIRGEEYPAASPIPGVKVMPEYVPAELNPIDVLPAAWILGKERVRGGLCKAEARERGGSAR